MRWLRILYPFGKIIAFFGVLMLAPAVVSVLYQDQLFAYYLFIGGGVIALGILMTVVGSFFRANLFIRHGFLLVTLIWTILPVFAAIPLVALLPDVTFTKGYFEATSGLTASGATVLTGLDDLPPSINFWRGEMSWIGGMGLVVLATAILPILGVGGSAVFQTEIPGPIKDSKITPQIAETAKALWLIYSGLTLICAAAYYFAGMDFLDSMIHAFTTMGLGGFSSHDASYGYFDSPLIESIAIFFMVIAGMNFALHYVAWTRGNWRVYASSLEWRVYLFLLLFAVSVVTAFLLWREYYGDFWTTLRYAAFNTISIATTTGYSNTDFAQWPLFAPLLILLLANFTACSGSTGGGVKLVRALIAFNQADTERKKLVHPVAYYDNKLGRVIPQRTLISVLFFILAYWAFILILTLFLLLTGMDFLTAFSAAVASVSNTGPGLGEVGPASNYAHLTDAQVWACAFAMLLGRLELMSFLVVIHRGFWRF